MNGNGTLQTLMKHYLLFVVTIKISNWTFYSDSKNSQSQNEWRYLRTYSCDSCGKTIIVIYGFSFEVADPKAVLEIFLAIIGRDGKLQGHLPFFQMTLVIST